MEKTYQIENLNEEKTIIGITIRTTNENGKCIEDMNKFWTNFYSEGLHEKIQGKINPNNVFGVYTNFESDSNGYYDYTIGYEVAPETEIPEGFIKLNIPKADYALFEIKEPVNMHEKIGRLWNNVWQADINRKYSLDFEIYDQNTVMSENPIIKVFISVNL